MTDPYLGEIRMVAFNYAPAGWQQCNGQILSINDNQSLYSLLGTTYGGDGRTTFGLPDMRGRNPLHPGSATGVETTSLGQDGGEERAQLDSDQIPHTHTVHAVQSESTGSVGDPTDANLAGGALYQTNTTTDTILATEAVTLTGGGNGRDNMQPWLCVNFIICVSGATFPPRN